MRKTLLVTAIVSAVSLTLAAPASAQVGRFDPGLQSLAQTQGYTEVRFRHGGGFHHGGFHHGGIQHRRFHHGGFHRRGGFRHGYGRGYRVHHHHGGGFGVGAGIAGLAAGAIIGGAIASQAAPTYAGTSGNAVAYCARKFKSYDPARGTYLGYDGERHACP